MVWETTNGIGCGIQHCDGSYGDRRKQTLVVYNYMQTGNFINNKIYDVGAPCSKCPGTCTDDKLCTV
ncbi:hypothetical protein ANCDUO_14527 [Ancylostoma duodenale]|uniref:SCP domain-containing protein n=1 Tax=Ancylostoma duodenale TaxID=51022 RepID=A0A0C2CG31_9BILA|nr:hypothetical protein ANCDUO_14527 [Ancylostoma duodenale]